MDLRLVIGEYVNQGRELLTRLRSPDEGPTVPAVDLHILRVQMFLIDNVAANLQELKVQHPATRTAIEVEEELPRLAEPALPPMIAPVLPPAEPV